MSSAEKRRAAGVNDHCAGCDSFIHLRLAQGAQWSQFAEGGRATQIHAHIKVKIGWAVGEVGQHLLYELPAVFDLGGPVESPLLPHRGEWIAAQRAAT